MALELRQVLKNANGLPADFPEDELRFWIDRLQALPAGTAEGCKEPLCYASERLAEIGQRHIRIEDEEAEAAALADDAMPPLARGMAVDLALGQLIGAIAYARAEYDR